MAQLKDLVTMGPARVIGDAFYGGVLMPTVTETQDIGSSTLRWRNIYAKSFGAMSGTSISVTGDASIGGSLTVTGPSTFNGNVTTGTSSTVTISNTAASTSNSTGALQVKGGILALKASRFADNVVFVTTATHTGKVTFSEATAATQTGTTASATFAGGIYVAKASRFAGTIWVGGNVVGSGDGSFAGNLSVTGTGTIGSTLSVIGATTLSSTLAVNGASTFNNNTTTTGVATFNGNVVINSSASADSLTAGSLVVSGNTSLINTANTSTLLPGSNNTYNIGSNALKYADIYATTLHGNLAADSITGILDTAHGGTGNNAFTANRLVWTETATKFTAGYHYASSNKIGINYTSEPSYTFAVNGSTYIGDTLYLKGTTYTIDGGTATLGSVTAYSVTPFIANYASNPNGQIKFGTRAGTSTLSSTGTVTYETTAADNWLSIYTQTPCIKRTYAIAGDINSSCTTAYGNYPTRLWVKLYSYNNTNATKLTYSENYYLPAVTPNRTNNGSYDILTSKNTVTVAQGGTGKASWTQWGILYASASTTLTNTAAGTAGYLLQGNGAAAPGWVSPLTFMRVFSRSDVGTSPNFDDPGFNGFFEVRQSSETTGETGTKPFNGYAGMLTMKTSDNVAMLQLAGSNADGWWIRGNQSASVTLSGVVWQRLVVADSNSYDISITGNAATASSVAWANVTDKYLDGINVSDTAFILAPAGGYYKNGAGTVTGAIKIALPTFKSSTMIRFYVDIYTYDASSATTFLIAGYNYSDQNWYNLSAKAVGNNATKASLKVRFGDDGSKSCIWIGETNTTWSYPQVRVRDVMLGHSGYTATNYNTGWAITFVTSFGTVKQTIENCQTWALNITGLAAKATADADNNTISSTYLKKSGGTMTGALTFANNTWNSMGDDCYIGDCNVGGCIGLKGINGTTGLNFVQYGGTAAGKLTWDGSQFLFNSEVAISSVNGLRFTYGSVASTESPGTTNQSVMLRNDGSVFWILCCDADTAGNNWYGNHPLYINLASHYTYTYRLYGAVWNDYAEYRSAETEEPGRCMQENDNGHLTIAQKRLIPGCAIISDTYGFAEGETDKCKTPVAVSGRVLAYPYRDRKEYHAGQAVCSAPNGTVDIMSREEITMYPDCIIGIVSEIPDYETWGTDNIQIDNRIWIKVK